MCCIWLSICSLIDNLQSLPPSHAIAGLPGFVSNTKAANGGGARGAAGGHSGNATMYKGAPEWHVIPHAWLDA